MYRSICCRFWTDPKVRKLSSDARYVFLYCVSSPHSHIAGLYYLPETIAVEETGLTRDRWKSAIQELRAVGVIDYDEDLQYVLVLRMQRYQAKNPAAMKAVEKHLAGLHKTRLLEELIGGCLHGHDTMLTWCQEGVHTLSSTDTDTDTLPEKKKGMGGKRRKPAPPLETEAPQDGVVTGQTVVAAWIDACRAVRGFDPALTGKDRAAAKRMSPLFADPDEVAQVLDLYLHDDESWSVRQNWALWALEGGLQRFRGPDGWRERGDERPCYDQPYEGFGDGVEDPGRDRGRGESDFSAIG